MTIKSDRWIREMAAQGMIEPFEPAQVRQVGEGGPRQLEGVGHQVSTYFIRI